MFKMKIKTSCHSICLGSLLLQSVVSAADKKPEAELEYEMGKYVVVATRTPIQLGELSLSTSFMDEEMIERLQLHTVVDVLKEFPGTAIVPNGHAGAVTSLFTRGTESNHTAIFINGRRLPAGVFGQYDLGSLGLENLSSIEFVRGPSSSLYGADAMGGVIDLRSRKASKNDKSLTLSTETGSFNTNNLKLNGLIGGDVYSIAFGVSHLKTDNDRPNSEFERNAGNLYATCKLSPSLVLDLQGLFYNNTLGVPGDERFPIGTPFGTYPANAINKVSAYLISPSITFQQGDDFSAQLFYSKIENTFEAAKDSFNNNHTFDEVGDEVQLLLNLKLHDKPVVLSGGLSYLNLKYDRKPTEATSTTTPFDFSYINKAIFTQLMWDINKHLRFIGSGRFDQFDQFENAVTGNVELSYYIPSSGTRFFAKYGEGMAPPEASDLSRLNGDLKSEKINAWEIGMRQELLDKRLALGFVYFNSKIKNLVDNDGGYPVANYEVVDTEQEGLESELIWQLNKKLRARISYTYLHAEVTSGNYFSDGPGTRLIRRPKHSIYVNLNYEPTTRAKLGLGMLSQIDREDPANIHFDDYEVFRVYGEYDINQRITCFGRIENLFNQSYASTNGYTNPGSAFYFGGRFKF